MTANGGEVMTTRNAAPSLQAEEAELTAAATIADVLERLVVDEAVSLRGAATLGDVSGLVDLMLARIASDASTIATLRKALARYGKHLPDCATRFCVCEIGGGYHSSIPPLPDHAYEDGKCSCGLSEGGVMEKCGKVGEAAICVKCGRTKKPIGRSAPMETYGGMCDFDLCAGYNLAPFPSDLWPGEVCEMVHPTAAKEGESE